jgi:hypothetical protein
VQDDLAQSGPFLGIGGMTVAAFLYAYAAITIPSVLHSVVMPLFWLAIFGVACRWFTRRPVAVVALPVAAVALWFALLLVP